MFLSQFDTARLFLRSTAIRQTLILLGVFTLITSIAWIATYWMVIRDTNRLVEMRLETLIDTAVSALSNGDAFPGTGAGQFVVKLPLSVEDSNALPFKIELSTLSSGYHQIESVEDSDRTDYIFLIRDAPGMRIIAGENVERLEETTDIMLAGLQFALITTVLATFVAGLWIARQNQARLDSVRSVLARVSQGDLDSRINLQGPDDDLRQLADRIDATTARLDSVMTQMRIQTANIAHDLRTPLARLRAVLEESHIALIERDEAVSDEVLAAALVQIDKIVETFNALLRIARIESGDQKSSFKTFDLGDIVQRVAEIFEPVIEERGQILKVSLDQAAHVTGDQEMITQLIGNLIQNALSHGAAGQTIFLRVHRSQLSLIDQGPGIPFAEREKVLQPLYQMEKQRQGEGFGLGLSLVNAICNLHDARLTLSDGPDGCGLSATIRFP